MYIITGITDLYNFDINLKYYENFEVVSSSPTLATLHFFSHVAFNLPTPEVFFSEKPTCFCIVSPLATTSGLSTDFTQKFKHFFA